MVAAAASSPAPPPAASANAIDSPERHARIQLPLVCGPTQTHEPDFATLRGFDTAARLPTAADVRCVVEGADSSLEREREERLPKGARAGVPRSVILNLRNRTAEVYADPDRAAGTYAAAVVLTVGDVLDLAIGSRRATAVIFASTLPGVG